jgi:hypothetical protein
MSTKREVVFSVNQKKMITSLLSKASRQESSTLVKTRGPQLKNKQQQQISASHQPGGPHDANLFFLFFFN